MDSVIHRKSSVLAIKAFFVMVVISGIALGFFSGTIFTSFVLSTNAENLILLGSFCATFVASVIAEEQNTRLKSGLYGLMGGTGAGAIAALVTNKHNLLLIGFAGSTMGALLGWLISLLLCAWVHKSETGRAVLTYLSIGFSGLREEIVSNERSKNKNFQVDAIRSWNSNKARTIHKQLTEILSMEKTSLRNNVVMIIVNDWLSSVVGMFEFLYKLGGNTLQNYRPRATVIRFSKIDGVFVGNHWVFNSGEQKNFNINKTFGENSIGFKVLTGQLPSPHFDCFNQANRTGENRGSLENEKSFITFYVSSDTILAIDWPSVLTLDDTIVRTLCILFEDDICPALGKLIECWYEPVKKDIIAN